MPVLLRDLTTLGLGGPARRLVEARSEAELVAAVREADAAAEPALLLAGGSNVVVADGGFDGTVVRVATSGVRSEHGRLEIAAGEPWDAIVERSVAEGLRGLECLSGIPGSAGATPIQNVGAYGQEVAATIAAVRALDRRSGAVVELSPSDCGFGYRTSALKRDRGRWVVLSIALALAADGESEPIRYAELARALDLPLGARAPLGEVRAAVLALRRAKGMVLDTSDPDTRSAGSFFTNPVLERDAIALVRARAGEDPPAWPEPDGRVKTSAAWLIERAGFRRGHGDPAGIAISSKHTLALTNRGGGSATELLALAREIAVAVRTAFGVALEPEPVLVGLDWP